jgi:tetratricopeptide (TPR) repeat protein
MNDYREALSFYEIALDIQQKSLPSDHPHSIPLYNQLSLTYRKLGEHSKAHSFQEKVRELQQKHSSSN